MLLREVLPRENKMSCEEATAYVHEFLDHELSEDRHSAVRAHLEACPSCWRKFEFEQELRDAICEKARSVKAPSYVVDRVKRSIFNTERKKESLKGLTWVTRKPAWAWGSAFFLIVAIGGAWIFLSGGRDTSLLVAELVRDHIQYATADNPSEMVSSDADEIESWLENKLGYSIDVPRFEGPEIHLIGSRLLKLRGKKVAYLIYLKGKHVLSLYVAKVPEADLCSTDLCADDRFKLQDCRMCLAKIQNCELCMCRHRNHNVLSWQEEGVTYAMVSDLDSDHMLDVTCPPNIPG